MISTLRRFLVLETATFLAMSLVHAGVIVGGYEHDKARIAETVIGAVLLLGAAWTWLRPERARAAAIAAQGFALAGTLVGLFTIAVGVGPRTGPDVAYHLAIVAVLSSGLVLAIRSGRARGRPAPAGPPLK